MSKNSRDSLGSAENVRKGLTEKAIAFAATASLVMPGIAYAESDKQDNDSATAAPLTTKILAEYKSIYGENLTPEGELAEDAAVHALLFSRDISREIAEDGELISITIEAQREDEEPKDAIVPRANGMTLIEEVVRRDLVKNGIASPTIAPGNLGIDTWSDEELQSKDPATIEDLLNVPRPVKVIAQIRTKDTGTGAAVIKQTAFAVPAYWTVPFTAS